MTSNVPVFSYALFGEARFLSAIEGQAPVDNRPRQAEARPPSSIPP